MVYGTLIMVIITSTPLFGYVNMQMAKFVVTDNAKSNRLLQQKKAQIGNNLAEQQVNSNKNQKQNIKHRNNSLHHYPKFLRLAIRVILIIVS